MRAMSQSASGRLTGQRADRIVALSKGVRFGPVGLAIASVVREPIASAIGLSGSATLEAVCIRGTGRMMWRMFQHRQRIPTR